MLATIARMMRRVHLTDEDLRQLPMSSELPPHLTKRISLTKAQLRTELGAELLNLCESVTADGAITGAEADDIRQWLEDSAGSDLPAASYLREVMGKVLADGEITPDERREIYRAVEKVLPPEVRRYAVAARREVETAERKIAKATAIAEREREREKRERNAPVASANFMVAGVRYEGRPAIIQRYAEVRDPVVLMRDRQNRFSSNAIAVLLENGKQIGFVPEEDASWLAPFFDRGARCDAYITKILTGGRSPIPVVQARLYRGDSTVDVATVKARREGLAAHRSVSSHTESEVAITRHSRWLRLLIVLAVAALIIALASASLQN